MKEKTKIFRWDETRKKCIIVIGTFNPNKKATSATIEMERRLKEKNQKEFI